MSKNQSVVSSKVETIKAKLQLIVCPDKVDEIPALAALVNTYQRFGHSGDHIKEKISESEDQVLRDEVILFLAAIDRNVSALMALTIEQLTLLSNKLRDVDNECLTRYGEVIKNLIIDKKTGAVIVDNFGVFDLLSSVHLRTCLILLEGIQKEKSFEVKTTPKDLLDIYSSYDFEALWDKDFASLREGQMANLLCLFNIHDLVSDRANNKKRHFIYRILNKGFDLNERYNDKKRNLCEQAEALLTLPDDALFAKKKSSSFSRCYTTGFFLNPFPVSPLTYFDANELFPIDVREAQEQDNYIDQAALVSYILLVFYDGLGESELREKRDELMAFDGDSLKEFLIFCLGEEGYYKRSKPKPLGYDFTIENCNSYKVFFEHLGEKGLIMLKKVRASSNIIYTRMKNIIKDMFNWGPDKIRQVIDVSILSKMGYASKVVIDICSDQEFVAFLVFSGVQITDLSGFSIFEMKQLSDGIKYCSEREDEWDFCLECCKHLRHLNESKGFNVSDFRLILQLAPYKIFPAISLWIHMSQYKNPASATSLKDLIEVLSDDDFYEWSRKNIIPDINTPLSRPNVLYFFDVRDFFNEKNDIKRQKDFDGKEKIVNIVRKSILLPDEYKKHKDLLPSQVVSLLERDKLGYIDCSFKALFPGSPLMYFSLEELFTLPAREDGEQLEYERRAAVVSHILIAFYDDLNLEELKKKRDELMNHSFVLICFLQFIIGSDDWSVGLLSLNNFTQHRASYKALFEHLGLKGLNLLYNDKLISYSKRLTIESIMRDILSWDPDQIKQSFDLRAFSRLSKDFLLAFKKLYYRDKQFSETPFICFSVRDILSIRLKDRVSVPDGLDLCAKLFSNSCVRSDILRLSKCDMTFLFDCAEQIKKTFPYEKTRVKDCLDFLDAVDRGEYDDDPDSDVGVLAKLRKDKKQAFMEKFKRRPTIQGYQFFETEGADGDKAYPQPTKQVTFLGSLAAKAKKAAEGIFHPAKEGP